MARRSKWSAKNVNVMPRAIRDSEFLEILADLGQLIYDEVCSLPDLNKSKDLSIATTPVEIASATTKRRVANE